MQPLLKEEYFHIGTDIIKKELWLYPQMDQIYKDYIKPYGGLWSSHRNNDTLCDWLEYKEEKNKIEELYHLKSSLIKFKENSKLLPINTNNDYLNLKDSGFIKILESPIIIDKWYYKLIINELIDYEKICNYYDLLYVNDMAHTNLRNYSIKTMYALSPECIEYYKPLKVDYKNHKILETKNKIYIEEPNNNYYKFIDYVKTLFNDINENNYEKFIIKLHEESKKIIKYLNENNNIIDIYEQYNINKILLIETVVKNIYREKYLVKQKILKK